MTPAELKNARNKLGLSQTELANALGMGKAGWQSVSRWENGAKIPGPVAIAVRCISSHQTPSPQSH